jgi:hypothetical protein
MKEPVDHILRTSLPWRTDADGAITECGYDASKVKALTREEYFKRLADLGRQRTAMITCMTCGNTVRKWSTWEDDPRQALGREIEWESNWGRRDRGQRLKDELLAIASLIEAHRAEFEATIAESAGRRAWLEKKAAMQKKASAPKPRGSIL